MSHSTSQSADVKPQCPAPDVALIPPSMKAEPRWVCWRYELRKENWTKTPINARTGGNAKSNYASTWASFDQAMAKYQHGGVDGIGFMLGDGWAGVDLDDHLDGDGRVSPFAEHVLRRLDSYHEVSPSGEGIKCFLRCAAEHSLADHANGIEVYGRGRYFTVTGRKWTDSPAEVQDRQSEFAALVNDLNPKDNAKLPAWLALSDQEKALAALEKLSAARADGYSDWIAVGMALKSVDASLLGEWDRWSSRSAKHDDDCCRQGWESFKRTGYTLGTLIYWADQDSPGWRDEYRTSGKTSGRGNRRSTSKRHALAVVRAADIEAQEIEWLWPNRIPLAMLTLLSADPGCGKSTLVTDIVARLSRGDGWPDSEQNREPCDSLLFLAEDDPQFTVKPRLNAAGADSNRVFILTTSQRTDPETGETYYSPFSIAQDAELLREFLQSHPNVKLVVLDPVTSYLGGVDDKSNTATRQSLMPLADVARDCRVAVVCISHLNKSGETKAVYRTCGSIAYPAVARIVWLLTDDPQKPQRRLLLCAKNNLGTKPDGLALQIVDSDVRRDADSFVGRCEWDSEPIKLSADDVLSAEMSSRQERHAHREQLDAAKEFLVSLLGNGQKLPHTTIEKEANGAGVAKATLKRAKAALGVVSAKDGLTGPWLWYLPGALIGPAEEHQHTEEAHSLAS